MTSSFQAENVQGDFPDSTLDRSEFLSTSGVDFLETNLASIDADFHLINDAVRSTPRSAYSGASSEVFSTINQPKSSHGKRPQSARIPTPKFPPVRTLPTLSSIPLPVKTSGPIKVPSLLKNVRSTSRTSSLSVSKTNTTVVNKHTLEIQFLNKNKRYVQMKKELVEKQKPVLDLYQNLIQIKKRLEELGKIVKLEDVKLVPFNEYKKTSINLESGESIHPEAVTAMRRSVEEIPKTLMDVCKNLLSRRALIVDLLESVTRSEVDISEVSDRIESLKNEGQQLQNSLDGIIAEHQNKIGELVSKWQALLSAKQTNKKADELEDKLKEQERLTKESTHVINTLQRKLEDRRVTYDKSLAELNGIIKTLREQINKLEQDLDYERRATLDIKGRHSTNTQNIKAMRTKMTDLENDKKQSDEAKVELQKKIRLLNDQLKHKEAQWTKEKDELSRALKRQDSVLQKLNVDKTEFETTLEAMEAQKFSTEDELQSTIESLTTQLLSTKTELDETSQQRDEALGKCAEFENYIARMGLECKENMNKVSCSMKWGDVHRNPNNSEADHYLHDIAKDVQIRELEDSVRKLEKERVFHQQEKREMEEKIIVEPTETEKQLTKQQDCISRYQMLLEDSENKLREKSNEVANLRSEIKQLKVRQEALEEQNYNCPTEELQKMVEEGRAKLNELMRKSIESEQKQEHFANVIEKQTQQMSEMENLLRYRENMAGVLKASRDELVLEKESLTRYSQEMRTVLSEVTKEGKMKDRLIKELQEKIDLRERQINKLEKEVGELETRLMVTNKKRFKLQEAIGSMEKELQTTKAHVNQLADINTRSARPKFVKPF